MASLVVRQQRQNKLNFQRKGSSAVFNFCFYIFGGVNVDYLNFSFRFVH